MLAAFTPLYVQVSAHQYIKQQIQYLHSLDVTLWAETKQSHDNDSVVLILFGL